MRKQAAVRKKTRKAKQLKFDFSKRAARSPNAAQWFHGRDTIVPPVEHHIDERGELIVVANPASFGHPIGAVAVLISKKGSVRAEHRHHDEGHICYLVTGAMEYREAPAFHFNVWPGQGVFTPPGVDHAFRFTEDSVVVVVANISRDQASYERDVVRLPAGSRLFET